MKSLMQRLAIKYAKTVSMGAYVTRKKTRNDDDDDDDGIFNICSILIQLTVSQFTQIYQVSRTRLQATRLVI